ncbi:MAG: rRNA maturation RNase YbeY [Phycisphaeraceae bacterium]|nr:rRNA maturation RNase YbeY [Phycisphaeraceae bacterium]
MMDGTLTISDRSGPEAGAAVDVADPGGEFPESARRFVQDTAVRAVRHLGAVGEVRVRIVGDEAMAAAHQRYLDDPTTTDVLTFDLTEGRGGAEAPPRLDTDVLVCADVAKREAARRGISPEHEAVLYVLHAILHCLGHDDHTPAGFARMHAAEDGVLSALGVGPVFGVPENRE